MVVSIPRYRHRSGPHDPQSVSQIRGACWTKPQPRQAVSPKHTPVIHLERADVDLPMAKRISGHKKLSMVARYGHGIGLHIEKAIDWLERQVSSDAEDNVRQLRPKSSSRLHKQFRTPDQISSKCLICMVPGGGIEPPTRGFSIHCSTPELPGHGNAISARFALFRRGPTPCPEAFCPLDQSDCPVSAAIVSLRGSAASSLACACPI